MTVALQCTNAYDRSVLILTILHSGFVGGTTECVNPCFFVPIFSIFQECQSVSIVVLRLFHVNLRVVRMFVMCLEMLTTSQCFASVGIIFQVR